MTNRKSRVTVVTSNRARSCTSDTPADLSLQRVAVPGAPSCKRIDLARNHFLTPRASPSAERRKLTTGPPQQAVKTARPLKSTLYPSSRLHSRKLFQSADISRNRFDLRFVETVRDRAHDCGCVRDFWILAAFFAPIDQFVDDVGIKLTGQTRK